MIKCAGLLDKWAGNGSGWQPHYFTLHADGNEASLYVSRTESRDQYRGCISVSTCTVDEEAGATCQGKQANPVIDPGQKLQFQVRTSVGRLPLRAPSPEDRAKWVVALRSVSDGDRAGRSVGSMMEAMQTDHETTKNAVLAPAKSYYAPGADRLGPAIELRSALQHEIEEVLSELATVDQDSDTTKTNASITTKASALQLLQFVDICLKKLGNHEEAWKKQLHAERLRSIALKASLERARS